MIYFPGQKVTNVDTFVCDSFSSVIAKSAVYFFNPDRSLSILSAI